MVEYHPLTWWTSCKLQSSTLTSSFASSDSAPPVAVGSVVSLFTREVWESKKQKWDPCIKLLVVKGLACRFASSQTIWNHKSWQKKHVLQLRTLRGEHLVCKQPNSSNVLRMCFVTRGCSTPFRLTDLRFQGGNSSYSYSRKKRYNDNEHPHAGIKKTTA